MQTDWIAKARASIERLDIVSDATTPTWRVSKLLRQLTGRPKHRIVFTVPNFTAVS